MELSRKNNRAKNQVPRPNYQTPECKTAITIMESSLTDPKWPNFARPSTVEELDSLEFGFPKFVSHEMVASRNYVKDGCLFLLKSGWIPVRILEFNGIE